MITKEIFTKALNIESPWYIHKIQFASDKLEIWIDFERGSTFHYEDPDLGVNGDFKCYDTKLKSWRHLNFFQFECILHAWVPRVDLGNDKVRQVKTPWEGLAPGFTLLFEAMLIELCGVMTVHQIAKMTGVYDQKIWAMLKAYINKARMNADYSEVKSVGVDETAARRGHDYVSLFVDMDEKKTIFVTEGKDSKTVVAFVKDLKEHQGDPEKIKEVSCDMSPAFIKGVTENLTEAEIVFDRFHVIKTINDAVDKVRRAEVKDHPILKSTRYIFLKNQQNLTVKQANKLQEIRLCKLNLKTMKALQLREAFQQIYQAPSPQDFETLLKKWYFWATHSRIPQIIDAAKTIRNHWEGVLSWAKKQISNGILEGFNSLFQAAKAKARGYKRTDTIITIIYLITAKLDFSKVNQHCATHS